MINEYTEEDGGQADEFGGGDVEEEPLQYNSMENTGNFENTKGLKGLALSLTRHDKKKQVL